jgi:PAS domain S-box-containing protein
MENKNNLRNILVVDDNEGNLILIQKLLRNNYNVTTSLSADDALKLVEEYKFDLILLDIMMSGIDGFEFCQILKSDPKTTEIPVIFLTARTDSESIVQGFDLGAVDYITKPFNKQELFAKIKNHLRLKLSKELIKQELIERLHAETKIKEQELTLRSILEYSYDSILIFETDRQIQNANLSALAKLNYSLEEIKSLKLENILPIENQEKILKEFNTVIGQNVHSTIECNLKTKDDKLIPVEININAINIPNKKVILTIIRDITERKQTERRIVSAIFQTEENERARFSKDIHDGLGALLSSINIYLNMIISQDLTQAEFENFIIYAKGLVDETIVSTREIANNLRPTVLTRFGLIESLKSFIEKISNTGKIKIDLNFNNFNRPLENDIEIIVFRIINELINNTLKHSEAKNIFIIIKSTKDKISVQYIDDGKGFDVQTTLEENKSTGGLNNIISRIHSISGKFSIRSSIYQGVKVNFEIPLQNFK